jgi:hypothetical protein
LVRGDEIDRGGGACVPVFLLGLALIEVGRSLFVVYGTRRVHVLRSIRELIVVGYLSVGLAMALPFWDFRRGLF